jgi:hypothetical protein
LSEVDPLDPPPTEENASKGGVAHLVRLDEVRKLQEPGITGDLLFALRRRTVVSSEQEEGEDRKRKARTRTLDPSRCSERW